MQPHLLLAHRLWKEFLKPHYKAIDATCGGGYDACFLAPLVRELSIYDIQKIALETAKKRFDSTSHSCKLNFYLASHEKFQDKSANLIVYNLGYLPGGDKSITTKAPATIASIKNALDILEQNGALSITCYPGHPEGEIERNLVHELLRTLHRAEWSVSHHAWINGNKAPELFWVTRITAETSPQESMSNLAE